MYAIITTGGKQYKVQPGDVLDIEKMDTGIGEKVTFPEVLAVGEGKDLKTGEPTLADTSVEGEVVDQFRDKKVVAFKMKRRKRYRRKRGHRQNLTKIKINTINAEGKTFGDAVGEKIEETAENIAENIGAAAEKVEDVVDNAADKTESAVEAAAEKVEETVKGDENK